MPNNDRNPDPSVHRRRLGKALRDARERSDMTQRDVIRVMDWSISKLTRIESGSGTVSTNDLRALLKLYGLKPEQAENLVEIGRAGRGVSQWNIYRDVASPDLLAYLGYESSAAIIRGFEPLLVPALLQTEDYAGAVIGVVEAGDPERVESLVDLRMERQEVLVRRPQTQAHFILDEAVIRRVVGSDKITRQQLRQLLEIAEQPNVTVRVVPFAAGLYAKLRAPYVLFEFDDADDRLVLYVESPFGEYVTRDAWPSRETSAATAPEVFLAEFWKMEHLAIRADFTRLVHDALRGLG